MSFANVSFKIIYNGEIRRFTKPRPSFEHFNSIIKSLLGTSYPSLRVCYRDEEGDIISVSSELEWDSALEYLSKDRLVRFVLYDRSVNPTASFFQKAEMGAQSVFGSQLESKKENPNLTKEDAEERRNKFLKSLEDCRPKTKTDPGRKQSREGKEEEEKKKAGEEIKKILEEELKDVEREKREAEERAKEAESRAQKETEERAKKEAEKKAQEEAELQKEREQESLRLQKQREQKEREEKEAEEQRNLLNLEEKKKQEAAAEEEERKRQEELVRKTFEEEEEKMRRMSAEENKKKASLLEALTEEWETFTDKHFETDEKNKQAEEKERHELEAEAQRKKEEEKTALLNQYQNELKSLREMGFFEQERNLNLLKKHSGSVALALDELVSS